MACKVEPKLSTSTRAPAIRLKIPIGEYLHSMQSKGNCSHLAWLKFRLFLTRAQSPQSWRWPRSKHQRNQPGAWLVHPQPEFQTRWKDLWQQHLLKSISLAPVSHPDSCETWVSPHPMCSCHFWSSVWWPPWRHQQFHSHLGWAPTWKHSPL